MEKNLKEFYELTINDPLFAAEGLDLDNSEWALEALKTVSKQLQIVDQSVKGKFYFLLNPLSEILHPFRFLRSFLKSERARRRFLATPNVDNAKSLIKSYYSTLKDLEKDLLAYKQACFEVQRRSSQKNSLANAYNFYNSKLTFEQFNSCLELMLNNAQALGVEINARNRLLLSSIAPQLFSKTPNIFPKFKALEKIPVIKGKVNRSAESKEIIEWIGKGRDYIHFLNQRYGNVNTELSEPIFYKLAQFDKKPAVHQFFVSFIKDKSGQTRSVSAILADQFHFLELERDKYKFYADIYTYESLIKKGIKYWYQPATSFYFTSDLTYYPDLLTTADISRRPYLNKEALLKQKSSLLDLLLWNGYIHNLSYLQNIQSRKKAGRRLGIWHYLLIGRSYPSLYYLSYNKSVWRIKQTPNFLGTVTSKTAPYITFDKLPKSLKKKDLQKIFMGGIIRAEDIDATLANTEK